MPFGSVAKFGKRKKKIDVLKAIPGVQTREIVENIVLEVIKERRTVRKYRRQDISDSDMTKILEAGRYAPSAGNQQPWEFIIIRSRKIKEQIAHACFDQMWIAEAPVTVVVGMNEILAVSKYKHRGEKLYGVQGTAAAIENMLIAAESLGIGSAWIGGFSERAVAIMTGCPDYVRPCAVLTFGYADEEAVMPPRQNLTDFIHHEHFGRTDLERKERNDEIF